MARAALAVAVGLASASWLAAVDSSGANPSPGARALERANERRDQVERERQAGEGPLVREGTEVHDLRGHFRVVGERVLFQPSTGGRPWPVLENLNLERVARTLQDSGKSNSPWSVSGTLTEFRGGNYLLLTRAVLKSAAPAGRPLGGGGRRQLP